MNYKEFKELLLANLRDYFPKEFSISIHPVQKNNGVLLDGLLIRQSCDKIVPTIYLQPFFEMLQNGERDIDEITDEIIRQFELHAHPKDFDPSELLDFEKARERIVFRLIHYERNRALLSDVPYLSYLDLAIIFCVLIKVGDQTGSVILHNAHAAQWGQTAEELFALAVVNTPRLLKADLSGLREVIKNETEPAGFAADMPQKDPENIYVLTNRSHVNGACTLLYPGILRKFSEETGGDFYVLPSSIHETLLVPADPQGLSQEHLDRLVREVNRTQVADGEVLSDHAYYYSCKTRQLAMHA